MVLKFRTLRRLLRQSSRVFSRNQLLDGVHVQERDVIG